MDAIAASDAQLTEEETEELHAFLGEISEKYISQATLANGAINSDEAKELMVQAAGLAFVAGGVYNAQFAVANLPEEVKNFIKFLLDL